MQSLHLVLMIFSVGNLADDFIQLYCGDNKNIKEIKVRKIEDFGGIVVWAECKNIVGLKGRGTAIRYESSGEEKMVVQSK